MGTMEPTDVITVPTGVVADVSESASSTVESAEDKVVSAINGLRTDVQMHGGNHSDALGRLEGSVRELSNAVTDALTRTAVAATEVVGNAGEIVTDVPGVGAETVDAVVETVADEPKKMKRRGVVRRGRR